MTSLIINDKMVYVSDTREISKSFDQMQTWRGHWPNFMPWELDTRDFSVRLDRRAIDAVQMVRDVWGSGLRVTSSCRNWDHNSAVGGKKNSDHLTEDEHGNTRLCTAFDIAVSGSRMGRALERIAIDCGFNAIGRYPVSRFIHMSMRPPKPNGRIYQWGRWH